MPPSKPVELYDPWTLGLHVTATSGQEFIVRCPYHDDSNASGSFNPLTGLFFCFSCGHAARVEELARHCGGYVRRRGDGKWNKRVPIAEWRPVLNSPLALGSTYLKKRRVTDEQVTRWGIRALPSAIAIPITDSYDREVGVIVRREQGTPRYLFFGDKPPLWPLGWLMQQEPGSTIYVVEGVFGRLRAERAGVPAVAVMGAMVAENVGRYLKNFEVIALFDNDPSGYQGAGRLLSVVPTARVIVPGQEADELSIADWQELQRGAFTTRSMSQIARLSGDLSQFYRRLPRERKHGWRP